MTHEPITYPPVYHTGTAVAEPDEPASAWVAFGRAVIAAHRPDGGTCQGCGRIWACCPVTVAARQHGLESELTPVAGSAYR